MSKISVHAGIRGLPAAVCGLAMLCSTSVLSAQPENSSDSMLARYQRAAKIQGANAHRWILNENLVPHWIPGTDRFWYRRGVAPGATITRVGAIARAEGGV